MGRGDKSYVIIVSMNIHIIRSASERCGILKDIICALFMKVDKNVKSVLSGIKHQKR